MEGHVLRVASIRSSNLRAALLHRPESSNQRERKSSRHMGRAAVSASTRQMLDLGRVLLFSVAKSAPLQKVNNFQWVHGKPFH